MTTTINELNPTTAQRVHISIALLMFGAVAGTCLLLVGLVHIEPLKEWMRDFNWEQNRPRGILPIYCFNGHFADYDERFLHEELPSADFSRGGVYFLGASTMKWALKPWDLPAETRPLIHNYAFGGVRHSDQADFLRYLVEEQGFLEAGPEKTLVVFGTNYRIVHHGRLHPEEGPSTLFRQMFTRHGFYTMEPDGTIHRSPRNALTEDLLLEPSRMTGFMRGLVNIFYTSFKSRRLQDKKSYMDIWVTAMESNWNEMMDAELGYLKKAFKYMKERKANVAVVLFPMQSWDKQLPYQAAYVEKLTKICESEDVKIYDFTKLLDDEEFGDSDHLNPNGVEKFQQAIMGLSLEHLRSRGVLPATETSNKP